MILKQLFPENLSLAIKTQDAGKQKAHVEGKKFIQDTCM